MTRLFYPSPRPPPLSHPIPPPTPPPPLHTLSHPPAPFNDPGRIHPDHWQDGHWTVGVREREQQIVPGRLSVISACQNNIHSSGIKTSRVFFILGRPFTRSNYVNLITLLLSCPETTETLVE